MSARPRYFMRRREDELVGPNSKKMTRKQYVNYRLRVLRELYIAPPSKEKIEEMLDEKKMSEIAVDAVFLQCIKNAR